MNDSSAIIRTSSLLKNPHGFSTRKGGVSTGIFSSLNLGMNRGDDISLVKENWRRFLDACSIHEDKFVCGKQVHGNYVHVATKDIARPAYGAGWMADADGYVTNEPGLPLAVFTADCVPVLLEDNVGGVVAAVHCGWRSTVADIEKETIDKMVGLGADVNNINIAIGPAICEKCFQVGGEVIEAVISLLEDDVTELYVADSMNDGKYYLNLRGVVKKRFMMLGVPGENIEISPECTMCQPDDYWSHRYTNGERGSQANIIMLKR